MLNRRVRHLNPASCGATTALDARFITGVSGGSTITSWAGRTGTSNNASLFGSTGPSYQAATLGGSPVVRFAPTGGANDNSQLLFISSILSSVPNTVVLVSNYSSLTNINRTISAGTANWLLGSWEGNLTAFFNGANFVYVASGSDIPGIHVGVSRSSDADYYFNGVGLSLGFSTTASAPVGMYLGGGFSGGTQECSVVDIAAVVGFDTNIAIGVMRRVVHALAFAFRIPCT